MMKVLLRYFGQSRHLILIVLSLSIIITIFCPTYSNAITKGLTLSPLRTELDIIPGTSQNSVLTIVNSTSKPITVDLNASEFSVIDQQYDYSFSAESNISKWVKFNTDEVNLAVGESRNMPFIVGVPLNAEPGGRYISLFASTNTDVKDNGVNSRQRVASLLYITVLGNVTRKGHLISLSCPWLINSDSMWSVALQNAGTTHFRSRYDVQIKNLLNNSLTASMHGDALILPGTVRAISDVLPLPQMPGIYKAVFTVGLGDTPAIIETRFIIYTPLWANLFITALIIFAIIKLYYRRSKKL